MSIINEALRLIRVFHDMKIKDLATQLDVSAGYVSDIEKGNKNPSLEMIEKYAQVFNTTSSAILFFAEELDKENNRGPFKIAIRNKILKFLQALEEKTIGKTDKYL
jgi:transcriptional regulator with XRE-family HTH domain